MTVEQRSQGTVLERVSVACFHCKKPIEDRIYYCTECDGPYHKGCMPAHANDWRAIHPLPNTLRRRTPYGQHTQCYCQCDDGDPRACHGWKGQQDEPPCECICHEELPDAEIERLRAALQHIADTPVHNTMSSRLMAREALAGSTASETTARPVDFEAEYRKLSGFYTRDGLYALVKKYWPHFHLIEGRSADTSDASRG